MPAHERKFRSGLPSLAKHPPIASWSHCRRDIQTFAFRNRDKLLRYASVTFVLLGTSGKLED